MVNNVPSTDPNQEEQYVEKKQDYRERAAKLMSKRYQAQNEAKQSQEQPPGEAPGKEKEAKQSREQPPGEAASSQSGATINSSVSQREALSACVAKSRCPSVSQPISRPEDRQSQHMPPVSQPKVGQSQHMPPVSQPKAGQHQHQRTPDDQPVMSPPTSVPVEILQRLSGSDLAKVAQACISDLSMNIQAMFATSSSQAPPTAETAVPSASAPLEQPGAAASSTCTEEHVVHDP